jgi:hypothetical protein
MREKEFSTPQRERWGEIIHHCVKAIDIHNALYFETGEAWHLEKAKTLRAYVGELKEVIKRNEG